VNIVPTKKYLKNQTVTSLRVNPKLWKLAKIEAIKRGVTLGEIVDISLRKELNLKNQKVSGE